MVANTGTYLDSPFHRFLRGKAISEMGLSGLVELEGVVARTVDMPSRAVDRQVFLALDVRDNAVLVHTGWVRQWATG
jgi:arylformamidase